MEFNLSYKKLNQKIKGLRNYEKLIESIGDLSGIKEFLLSGTRESKLETQMVEIRERDKCTKREREEE